MTTDRADDATFKEQAAQLSRDCDSVIEACLSKATEAQREAYHRDLKSAKWIIEEVDRKEITTPKSWAAENDHYAIFAVIALGGIGLLLSLFSGMRGVVSFINDRSFFLIMIFLPILLWSFYSMTVIEVQKRIDIQTLELLWAKWTALGLPLSLLEDTIQYGDWKSAERDAEDSRYGLTPRNSELRKLRLLQYEFQLKAVLIRRHDAQAINDFWRYIEQFWKLEKMLETE